MHYVLFFPMAIAPSNKLLEDNHLGDLLRGCGPDMIPVAKGPDGKRGILATWNYGMGNSPDVGQLRSWTWKRFVVDGQEHPWMLGWQEEPTPDDLARKVQIPGSYVELGDGKQWMIPESQYVPRKNRFDSATRSWMSGAPAEYEDFCSRSEEYAKQILSVLYDVGQQAHMNAAAGREYLPEKAVQEFNLEGVLDFLGYALALNYRVTPEIISEFGLFDDDSIARMLHAIIGQADKSFMRIVKKKAADNIVSIPIGSTT